MLLGLNYSSYKIIIKIERYDIIRPYPRNPKHWPEWYRTISTYEYLYYYHVFKNWLFLIYNSQQKFSIHLYFNFTHNMKSRDMDDLSINMYVDNLVEILIEAKKIIQ